jgi:signal transduction histidine kinase
VKLTIKLPAVVVGAILFTAVASGAVSVLIGRYVLRQAALDESVHRLEAYASAIVYYVGSARSLLTTTAESPNLRTLGAPREVAARVLAHSDVFEYLMLLTPEGTVTMQEPHALEERLSHRDLSFSAWFEEVRGTNRTVVSDLHISPATQRPTIVVATPVHAADGRTIGIWAGALKLGELSEIGSVASDRSGSSGWGYVTDRRGLIIAHQSKRNFVENQTDFSSQQSVSAALSGQQGSGEYFNAVENESKLTSYRPLPDLGWAVVYGIPTGTALAPLDALTWGILSASVGLAALIGAGVFVSTRRAVAPLARLTAAAQTVGTGDFSRRIEVPSGDEVGQLADEFNRMTAAIAEKDVLLRARAAELARSNAELEQFAYVASHDLQEPLRMVVGYVQLLEKRLADKLDPDTREFMGFAVDGALRMQNLIQDILAYSRVSTKGQPLAPVDSAAALKEALDSLASRIAETGSEVKAQTLPMVMADRTQLVQLFQNLISNAIKFCKDHAPRVRVEAAHGPGRWRFAVTDNGIGIAPEYRGQLFVIFKRLHTRREYPGTGIGLAICKRIVERHGGEIGIESAPDGGSVFWFTLPEEKTT